MRRGSGDGGGRGEQMEGSEYEMNKFLFDYHLIFDFLFISNRDTCDDSITQDFKDGKLPPKTKVKHIIVREYLGYKNRRHDKQHYN